MSGLEYAALRDVTTLVVHGPNCPDGRASAIILADALPNAEIVFCEYETPLHKALEPKPGVLFCDFTPWVERAHGEMTEAGRALAQRWVDAGAIVLDHHKGAADLVAMFGTRGVFADEGAEPGVSGAVLAFAEVWMQLPGAVYDEAEWRQREIQRMTDIGVFARLAGVRDTWQRKSPNWKRSCEQAAALLFWPWATLMEAGIDKIAEHWESNAFMKIGAVLLQRDYDRDTQALQEAYGFAVVRKGAPSPLNVLCFEGLHTSDLADRAEGADVVVGWHYLVEGGVQKIRFSTRSRGDFSCLDFAKEYGGSGHKNAAGFKVEVKAKAKAIVSAQDYSPYKIIERLLERHLREA